MRKRFSSFAVLLYAALCAAPLMAQGAPPQGGADQPYTVEYYYKVQWGHQQEFLSLFLKNHYPLLKKIESTGRIVGIKIESPAYHTTEDGRWDYRVTIRFKNSTVATTANPDEEAVYPGAVAGPGDVPARRAAAVRDSAGALGFAGDGYYAGAVRAARSRPAHRADPSPSFPSGSGAMNGVQLRDCDEGAARQCGWWPLPAHTNDPNLLPCASGRGNPHR